MTPGLFAFELAAGVATITLDRPDRLNALTFDIYRELAETFEQLDRHGDVRAVVRNHRVPAGRPYLINPITREIVFDGFRLDDDQFARLFEVLARDLKNTRMIAVDHGTSGEIRLRSSPTSHGPEISMAKSPFANC